MNKELATVNEVHLSYKRPRLSEMPEITHRLQLVKLLRELNRDIGFDISEQVWVALMTSTDHLLGISKVNVGTIKDSIVNVRAILQLALVSNAVNIALIHNHPSGSLMVSKADKEVAKNIKSLGKIVDVVLTDAIIITSESHRSYFRLL